MQLTKFEFAAQHRDRDSELDEGHGILHSPEGAMFGSVSWLRTCSILYVLKQCWEGECSRANCYNVFFADGEGANVLTSSSTA